MIQAGTRSPNTYSSQITHTAIFSVGALLFAIFAFSSSFREPDFEIDAKANTPRTIDFLEFPVRRRFVQKVYSMVTLQLCLTSMIVVLMMRTKQRLDSLARISGISSLVAIILLAFMSHVYPLNGILFVFFTCATGITVGNICVKYQERQGVNMVLRAFMMTMVIFISLTMFTMFSTTDFAFLGPFLFTGLMILIMECLCTGFYGGKWTPVWFGALLFSAYIIYDTNQIVRRYHPRDWLRASLDLYLDVINLFLEILKILAKEKTD
jgi:hypothetical protein